MADLPEAIAAASPDVELGYIRALVGAAGNETTYEAVRRFMYTARARDEHLHDVYKGLDVVWGSDPFAAIEELKAARSQVGRLAQFIINEVPGEPSQDQGAVETAIRLLRGVTMTRRP